MDSRWAKLLTEVFPPHVLLCCHLPLVGGGGSSMNELVELDTRFRLDCRQFVLRHAYVMNWFQLAAEPFRPAC